VLDYLGLDLDLDLNLVLDFDVPDYHKCQFSQPGQLKDVSFVILCSEKCQLTTQRLLITVAMVVDVQSLNEKGDKRRPRAICRVIDSTRSQMR